MIRIRTVSVASKIDRERRNSESSRVSNIGSKHASPCAGSIATFSETRMLTAYSRPHGLGMPRTLGPAEGSDHLFLLPKRALDMDSVHLRQDLAGLDFNLHLNLLHTAPKGNVWLCKLASLRPETKDSIIFKKKQAEYRSHETA